MGSTNGTFVNGVQITSPQLLNPGDSVGIGQTALVFQMAGGQQMAAPQYQAPQQQQPAMAAAPPPQQPQAAGGGGGGKALQYGLYGCGCLLLLCICNLLLVAAWALLDPISFGDVTGIDVSMRVIETVLNLS
jgi:hypothetical protein